MSYEFGVKNDGPDTDGWAADPKIVIVATGSHDCSRLIQALRYGVTEQSKLAQKIAAAMNRKPLGRRVTELLKRHGGEDLTWCGHGEPGPAADTSAAMVLELDNEITHLRSIIGHAGHLRMRGGWFWCERGEGHEWVGTCVENPVLDEWDHVAPLLFVDDRRWIDRNGGKAGDMADRAYPGPNPFAIETAGEFTDA